MDNSVVLCFDENYGPAAVTVLTSLFINNPQRDYRVDLICSPCTPELTAALARLQDVFNRQIHVHAGNFSVSGFRSINHVTAATYFRFLIPELVPCRLVVYLDCDLIVQTSLAPLFEIAGEKKFCGVPDLCGAPVAKAALGLDAGEPYLNAGVIAFDNELWRRDRIAARVLEYHQVNERRITWHDQCALNGGLAGDKTVLEQRYNLLYQDVDRGLLAPGAFDAAAFDGVLHYNSRVKPWHRWCRSEFKALWDKYAAIAPSSPAEIAYPRTNLEWSLLGDMYIERGDFESAAAIYRQLARLGSMP